MAERTLPKNGELHNSFSYQHWKYRSFSLLRQQQVIKLISGIIALPDFCFHLVVTYSFWKIKYFLKRIWGLGDNLFLLPDKLNTASVNLVKDKNHNKGNNTVIPIGKISKEKERTHHEPSLASKQAASQYPATLWCPVCQPASAQPHGCGPWASQPVPSHTVDPQHCVTYVGLALPFSRFQGQLTYTPANGHSTTGAADGKGQI